MVETLTRTTATELKQAMASDRPPIVINTLGPEAYRSKRIPGSINVPTDEIERVQDLVPAQDAPVVVYCANEDCAPRRRRRSSSKPWATRTCRISRPGTPDGAKPASIW